VRRAVSLLAVIAVMVAMVVVMAVPAFARPHGPILPGDIYWHCETAKGTTFDTKSADTASQIMQDGGRCTITNVGPDKL